MLYEEIKKLNIEALKSKNTEARAIYSVLIGKIDLIRIEKRKDNQELEDNDCIKVIQKSLKELEDEKENYQKVNNLAKVEAIKKQIEYAKALLPEMLTKEEIEKIISNLQDKSIPSVMRYFKENYAGKCEMSLVSNIAKNYK